LEHFDPNLLEIFEKCKGFASECENLRSLSGTEVLNFGKFHYYLSSQGMDHSLFRLYNARRHTSYGFRYPIILDTQPVIFPLHLYVVAQLEHSYRLLLWGSNYYQKSVNRYFASNLYEHYIRSSKNPFGTNKVLFQARHSIWIRHIDEIARNYDDYLIVFGILHMFGKEGILKMLKSKGYQIQCYHVGENQFIDFYHKILE
jgi:TraB/PrgY/gumN family